MPLQPGEQVFPESGKVAPFQSLLSVLRAWTSPGLIPRGLRQEAAHPSGLGIVPTRPLDRWSLSSSQGSLAWFQPPTT